jgi:hypothetical protein
MTQGVKRDFIGCFNRLVYGLSLFSKYHSGTPVMIDYEMIAAREAIAQSATAVADVQSGYVAIYLTVLFAYISVAYLAGSKLTRFQLIVVTLMFIAAAGRQVALISAAGIALRAKIAQLAEAYEPSVAPDLVLATGASIWWPVAIWSTGILGSLLFMWSVRRSRDT